MTKNQLQDQKIVNFIVERPDNRNNPFQNSSISQFKKNISNLEPSGIYDPEDTGGFNLTNGFSVSNGFNRIENQCI